METIKKERDREFTQHAHIYLIRILRREGITNGRAGKTSNKRKKQYKKPSEMKNKKTLQNKVVIMW